MTGGILSPQGRARLVSGIEVMDERRRQLEAVLRWYVEAGVDEAVGEVPVNRFRAEDSVDAATRPAQLPTAREQLGRVPPPAPADPAPPAPTPPAREPVATGAGSRGKPPLDAGAAARDAASLAAAAESVAQLERALAGFEGCGLSRTAMNLVFGDGAADAKAVFIGEAPGAEEDRLGKPFVGPSGRLLDKMLASIGLDRGNVFISNTIYWRPPGNRSPTSEEIAICAPFLERLIELIDPALLVALGGPAAAALLGQKESVGRLRGRWFQYRTPRMTAPIPATALFHPAYLLRTPGQKRLAWRDLLALKLKLSRLDVGT